ncbi:peptidoglycan-binding domain-containing protein [Micromonospora arborensis]|uniref:peptidoglycan-binding domain-containing protein n=1 Tax=Micromonospora arborensis TaxID=2116518 RepID=UPI0037163B46
MAAPWVLVGWAEQFRAELNAIAPTRDKASDGSVGDLAHQGSSSGHNPDETGNAERRDSDNINEVRAIDVDRDVRVSGLTAEKIVAYLVGRCRAGLEKRLIYIIFNRVIWSASTGWVARTYTGSNPHDRHFHLSGDPNGDSDRRSWGLASLVGKTPPAQPKPPTKPLSLGSRLLKKGVKGADVGDLQELLNKRGAKLAVDDDFGAKTDAAVRAFQRSHWLSVDGVVGPDTLGALRTNLGGRVLKRGMNGADVGELQRLLNKRGAKLAVDNDFGPATQVAVRNFQKSRRLGVDGEAGPKTVGALRS